MRLVERPLAVLKVGQTVAWRGEVDEQPKQLLVRRGEHCRSRGQAQCPAPLLRRKVSACTRSADRVANSGYKLTGTTCSRFCVQREMRRARAARLTTIKAS
eukprot:5065242-Prymnesium_polylepis.1